MSDGWILNAHSLHDNECTIAMSYRCQDYILIDHDVGGTTEICGNTTGKDSVLGLESGEFNVFFRSSEQNKYGGFQMYIICFQVSETNLEGVHYFTEIDLIIFYHIYRLPTTI